MRRKRRKPQEGAGPTATYLVTHDVDDVDHWASSPARKQVFGPLGISVRPFRGAPGTNQVGLIMEIPDIAAVQEFMKSPAAADAMKQDGVRPETLVVLTEA